MKECNKKIKPMNISLSYQYTSYNQVGGYIWYGKYLLLK